MTDQEKASKFLSFIEEILDTSETIAVLAPLLKDSDLAKQYDKMVADGIIK